MEDELRGTGTGQGASPGAKEAVPWGWSMAQVRGSSRATTAMEKICRERKEEKKGKKAAA